MAGQGCPRTSQGRFWRGVGTPAAGGRHWLSQWHARGWIVLAPFVGLSLRAAGDEMRLRIAWGGGAYASMARNDLRHRGLDLGASAAGHRSRRTGLDVDRRQARPGGALVVRQRSPRGYDGVDLLVSAPPTAKLLVELSADDDRQAGPADDPAGRRIGRVSEQGIGRPRQPPAGDAGAGRLAPRAAGARQPRVRGRRNDEVLHRAARLAVGRGKQAADQSSASRFRGQGASGRGKRKCRATARPIPWSFPLPEKRASTTWIAAVSSAVGRRRSGSR